MISADGLLEDALMAFSREPQWIRVERSNLRG
jgi:hypothetical protein